MVEIHKSNYFLIEWEKSKDLFHYVFNQHTAHMTATEYINELKIFIKLVRQHKPKYVLGDMIEFGFVITPDIQEWINENLFTVYQEIGFKKIAILLSKEFIASLSIEQTMDEDSSKSFKTAFFDNANTAQAWLDGKVKLSEVYG